MKNTLIFITSRVIKIFANITKLSCYVFHFIFPNKRFLIPEKAKPLIPSKRSSTIPRILWQTNYTNLVTLPIYINYLFNRLLSYNYEYRFMTTEDRAEFINTNFDTDTFNAYSRIQIGAAQADLWRLLVLHKHGGVYMDIDAHLIWPLNSLIKNTDNELYIVIKRQEFSNYFIASKKDNNDFNAMINLVLNNIKENTIKNVYDLTGPGVFNKVLNIDDVNTGYYRYTCNQGNFTNEHFQYIDKKAGKWTREQEKIDIIK